PDHRRAVEERERRSRKGVGGPRVEPCQDPRRLAALARERRRDDPQARLRRNWLGWRVLRRGEHVDEAAAARERIRSRNGGGVTVRLGRLHEQRLDLIRCERGLTLEQERDRA